MADPARSPVINWRNGVISKLGPCPIEEVLTDVAPLLIRGESVLLAFKSARDYVAFTSKRIIAVNLKGLTGKKRDYTSLPYTKYHVWTVGTSGGLDQDHQLEINLTVVGKLRFEFRGDVDMKHVSYIIAANVLA